MDAVDITVPYVDSDSPEGEAVLLSRAMDSDGRVQHAHSWEEVSTGR